MTNSIRLTQFAHGAGCGCKIAPAMLEEILKNAGPDVSDKKIIVGNSTRDDAAVYALNNELALISTTDFFMPIVDDAYDFGRIAAANAISDIYAMGGKPILALAILGWPVDKLPAALAGRVLEGAKAICKEAGITIAGGHSIDSPEPVFGLAVNGLIDIKNIKTNAGAQPGDLIYLTKPIGTGILTTAAKKDQLLEEHGGIATASMTRLNVIGQELGALQQVHAMTDITGFGLAGHLIEMANASNNSMELYWNKIPQLVNFSTYINQRLTPDATFRNWNGYGKEIDFEKGVPVGDAFAILPDPQTNGGLLICVDPEYSGMVEELFNKHNLHLHAQPIGRVVEKTAKLLMIKN